MAGRWNDLCATQYLYGVTSRVRQSFKVEADSGKQRATLPSDSLYDTPSHKHRIWFMLSLTETIEIAAVVTGAVYGVLLARRHGMDFVGVFSVSFMTAFGGGTLRDVLLDRHPLFWIRFEHYPVLVFIVCAITSLIRRTPGWLHKSLKSRNTSKQLRLSHQAAAVRQQRRSPSAVPSWWNARE